MRTRGLTGLGSHRIADTVVGVVYNHLTLDDDGSSAIVEETEYLYASIQALQPKEIQRLQEGGIVLKNGVSMLIADARNDRPDKILYYSKKWRIINWSFSFEFVQENGGSGETYRGTVVATCDEIIVPGVS